MRATAALSLTAFLALSFASAEAGAQTYAVAGTRATEVKSEPKSKAQIVLPTTTGTYPLIVASHGFSANGSNQLGWAKHFASWGFVVAVPTFASSFAPNHQANATVISDLVKELSGASASKFSVAPGKYGLEGHSAGGLSTTLAAAGLTPSAVVLFDPVDAADAGKKAYADLCAPVLSIFAASGSCNNNAGWRAFVSTTKSPLIAFDVVGSTHCDGENEPRPLCATFCGGGAVPARQALYSHYATAFFLSKLVGDPGGTSALAAAEMSKDTKITGLLQTAGTCTPATPQVDGGTPPGSGDGGASSSSSSSSGDPTNPPAGSDAGGVTNGASDADTADGCGCRSTGTSSSGALFFALGAGALILAARRRRR